MIYSFMTLLAQTPSSPVNPAGPAGPTATPPTTSGPFLFMALMMAMVVFMILSSRSQKKKEKRERDNMFESLARSDRVLTVGGIVGTVLSVKDSEIILKVDESTNTKMTFVKTAIQRVIKDDEPAELKK